MPPAAKKSGRSTRSKQLNLDLLRDLCETPGVPGREERVQALIESEVEGLFDEIETDALGSLICRRGPRSSGKSGGSKKGDPTRVMLLCHMDEIGFYVSHVSDEGFLSIDPAGGFDPRTLFARRVKVCTDGGDYPGVMNPAGKPIHLSTPEERSKVPDLSSFFIDVGMTGAQAKQRVQIGDYVVMDEPAIKMGGKFVSKALDNRVACWLGIEAIRELDALGTGHRCEVVVAFTSQEEVGLRGAKAASYAVRPDIGIGIDVTLSCDTPGVPADSRVTLHGKGFGLHVKDSSFIADYTLVQEIEAVAKKHRIPYQRSILGRGGQDGAAAQQAAAGARAVGVTVGTRYIHTVTESIDVDDLRAARDVLARYLTTVK
ncbi:MAG: M20/M25/M40 family metallo-hydrolase [Planctomycetota bacterium]